MFSAKGQVHSWDVRIASLVMLVVGSVNGYAATTPVAVTEVGRVELADRVALVGSALAKRSVVVSPQVSGLVERIWFEEGSRIKAGERLLQLDAELARIDVERSSAQLEQVQAELRERQRQLREARRLRESGHVPASALETAENNVAVATAVVGQTRAQLASAQALLDRFLVTAPFAGVVTRKLAELGQWLSPGSPALELVGMDTIRIEVAVPQRYIGSVKLGSDAIVQLDAFPGRQLNSRVEAIIPRDVNTARTVPVWLSLANSDGSILPGMSARVSLGLQRHSNLALAVPNDALVRRADGSLVLWLITDGEPDLSVRPVTVSLGRRDSQLSEIVSGEIHAGDRVVVRGNESLRPGQAVYIVEDYPVGGD